MTKKKTVKIEIKPPIDIKQFKADQVQKADKNGGVSVVSLSGMDSQDIARLVTSLFGE